MRMSSAEVVANIEELLTKILVAVPLHSIARFKCVSKHWLSLISSIQNPKISAFFSCITEEESFKSIPLSKHEIPPGWNPFKTLTNSVPDGSNMRILQSCNGLILCHIPLLGLLGEQRRKHRPVYVVNPTTNQFRTLSSPSIREDMSIYTFIRYALVFDPSKSPHYKVVCVTNQDRYDGGHHDIDIYSSDTREWKHLKTSFFPSPLDEGVHHDLKEMAMHFDNRSKDGAVYCNGAVHWIRNRDEATFPFCLSRDINEFMRNESDVLHYFDVCKERFLLAPATPPVPLVVRNIPLVLKNYSSSSSTRSYKSPSKFPSRLTCRYFGQCCGRLYLIEIFVDCSTEFEVMEMESDYSGWFVKYNVDVTPVFRAPPRQNENYAFVVLCLSREEENCFRETDDEVEDSSTVILLHIPGKVITYSLRNKTFKTFVELAKKEPFPDFEDYTEGDDNYPYMKSLACV